MGLRTKNGRIVRQDTSAPFGTGFHVKIRSLENLERFMFNEESGNQSIRITQTAL